MEVTEKMLIAAMKKAVELSIYPQFAEEETYLKRWADMKKVLQAALQEKT